MHTGVPLLATWKTFLKKLSCTFCILSICLCVSPIQLSQFVSIFEDIFISIWTTPVKELLAACGWLSVKQLAMYHTVVLVYKVLRTGTPSYISSMFSTEYRRMTRQALQGMIKPSRGIAKQELTNKSFRFRAVHDYNLLPVSSKGQQEVKKIKFL